MNQLENDSLFKNPNQNIITDNSQQTHLTNNQYTQLERDLLLGNNRYDIQKIMSNWAKVLITALSLIIPGVGQIFGIIAGLIYISNDDDSDRRSFGAALLTMSIIMFILHAIFWYIFAMAFGPNLYY